MRAGCSTPPPGRCARIELIATVGAPQDSLEEMNLAVPSPLPAAAAGHLADLIAVSGDPLGDLLAHGQLRPRRRSATMSQCGNRSGSASGACWRLSSRCGRRAACGAPGTCGTTWERSAASGSTSSGCIRNATTVDLSTPTLSWSVGRSACADYADAAPVPRPRQGVEPSRARHSSCLIFQSGSLTSAPYSSAEMERFA